MNKKNNMIIFAIFSLIIALFIWFLIPEELYRRANFLFSDIYHYIIYIALVVGLGVVFYRIFKKSNLNLKNSKLVYWILFIPIAVFPAIRCYFKIPYTFCSVCPKKCPWGVLRPITLPSFLVLNLNKRFWCYNMCPFGTLQDYQSKVCPKRIVLPKWLINLRYIILSLAVLVTIFVFTAPKYLVWFFKDNHHIYLWSLSFVVLITILSFFVPRFFCNYVCPIGSFGDLALKVESKFKKK